jgi:hypothetical protein
VIRHGEKTSKLGEGINDFRVRAMRNEENDAEPLPGSALPWILNENQMPASSEIPSATAGPFKKAGL